MGLRGPQPTPTAILKARGSWRADIRTNEPSMEPGVPECPRKLTKAQLAWWDRTVAIMLRMKTLTLAHGEALSRYCVFADEFDKCRDVDERIKVNRELKQCAASLGLTPASTSTVPVIDSAKAEEKPDMQVRLRIAE
jgi:phage terminase small subunit